MAFRVWGADVRTWLRRTMPVVLVVSDASKDVAYWLYVQRYFANLAGFDLTSIGQTLRVYIPLAQTVTQQAIQEFAAFRDQVLGRIGGDRGHD